MTPAEAGRPSPGDVLPLGTAARTWFAISLQTFGGPAGQIAVMQRILVEEKRWIGQRRFLFALSYCTLLPGPEAQQLATYVGWLLNGVRGALVAGTLFVLPGVVTMGLLSGIYVGYGESTAVEALFLGLAPAVIAIVVQAVLRVSRRGLGHRSLVAIAVASFVALALFNVAFPAVVAAAGLTGWLLGRWRPGPTGPPAGDADDGPPPLISDHDLHTEQPSVRRGTLILVVGLTLWAAPVVAAALLFGRTSVFVDQALFFSGAALVTFGGAYRDPGTLSPWVAAVVGVIGNLAVYFAVHTLFADTSPVTSGVAELRGPRAGNAAARVAGPDRAGVPARLRPALGRAAHPRGLCPRRNRGTPPRCPLTGL